MFLERTLHQVLEQASRQFSVILLTGARQVGKSTLIGHVLPQDVTKVTLDDPILLELAKRDPALFMQSHPAPLFIDEIQYALELLPYIKMAADQERRKGMFWLTGSQQFHLMKGVSESLAGRVAILELYGLSLRESQGKALLDKPFVPSPELFSTLHDTGEFLDVSMLFDKIWRGSYPGFLTIPDANKELFYGSYVNTYLQRDVKDLANIGDQNAFMRFLIAAAARTGQLLNYTDISRDVGISTNTAKSWMSVLEASGIVYILPAWHHNKVKQLTKSPKLHFLDTGLCTWLTRWASPETLEKGAFAGQILESWVVGQVLRSFRHNGMPASLYHYRDAKKAEVDLVIEVDNTLYPVEVKKSASPSLKDVKPMDALDALPVAVGQRTLLCSIERMVPLDRRTTAFPLSFL